MRNGRDPDKTRQNILGAATEEFAHHGLGGARVDRIASRAGANKRMLYYYFGSKEALFLAVLEAAYERIRSAERELDLEHADPREALKRLVGFTWRYSLEHPEFQSLLASENMYKASHLKRSRRVHRLHSPLVGTLRDILRRGERLGLFRTGIDPVQLYISIAAEGYFYLSNRYTLSSIFARDLMAPRALAARARHVREMILNSVCRGR
jgi:AcrR family transcriptional regulator